MKTKVFILCYLLNMSFGWAQLGELQVLLYDQTKQKPISNAHVFLVNTTYGTTADELGQVRLNFPETMQEDLLITHISYDTRLLEHIDYRVLSKGDTLYLNPNNFDLSEVVITSKRSNSWKKNFKKFQKAFLGDDKIATKCRLINPEVLRFEEIEGTLTASAVDLLQIENPHLGYTIYYLLTYLKIEADGSTEYLGRANFVDTSSDDNKTKIAANRAKIFQQSPKHFFKNLLANQIQEAGYEVQIVLRRNEELHPIETPNLYTLLKVTPEQNYQLFFPEFLEVTNTNIKSVSYNKMGVRPGGLESSKFSGSVPTENAQVESAKSYLYKKSPFLLLNKYGNLLNSKQVKEYGYWANQRMAQQLPFDYGNDYEVLPAISTAPTTTISTVQKGWTDQQKIASLRTLFYTNAPEIVDKNLKNIADNWTTDLIPPLIDLLNLSSDPALVRKINALLQSKTGVKKSMNYYEWLQWLWKQDKLYTSYYGDFKAELYKHIDPKFEYYFKEQQATASIRLDEIVWGGVRQDGIPPLRHPNLIPATAATYLAKSDLVFGLYINGEARAYPKRILAWHEFFVDTFGSTTIAGVYCTLCGTVIAYDMDHHELGTSGFLYRSNKLMYDKATQSLWSTIEGKPVVGSLVAENIDLATHPVVTTTWGEWKKQHPSTKVLSLETGHLRDYAEGAAYQEYFATDNLMFPVPQLDSRLANKAEVFIVRAPNYREDPLAISIAYLKKKGWYQGIIDQTNLLVLTDKSGAARAYSAADFSFSSYKRGVLKDEKGETWTIQEEYLQGPNGERLERLSAHNIFWFAWFNSYQNTRLVK